jgi:hypothetical protein
MKIPEFIKKAPLTTFLTKAGTWASSDNSLFVNTIKGIPEQVSKQFGQPALRGFGGVASAITGKPFTPVGTFQKSLYGTDKPITLSSVGKETRGGIGGESLKIDPVLGLLAGLSDAIPGGQGAKRETKALVQGSKALKGIANERRFLTSAKEAVSSLDTRVAGQYISRNTDSLAIKAKNLIRDNIAMAEKLALTESDDSAVAVASELIKKYGDDATKAADPGIAGALYDKAAEIANTLAPKLTEQGRSIQAASILGRLTPEGQLRFAAREIQRYNELNPRRRIPELSGEQAKFISEEMRAIQLMPEGTEKAVRFQNLQNSIQDLVPTPLFTKIKTIWKAGLLTGFKTHELNMFSNLSHSITETAKDVPAAVVDSVASLFTGQRTKTFTTRGSTGGLKEGFEKGLRYFKTGYDERDIASKLDYKRVNFGKGPVAKAFQAYTDTVFRTLGSSDQPFYYGALSRSLMDQSLAQGKNLGLKGTELIQYAEKIAQAPTEEMIRYGVADATTAVFQNKTKLGDIARGIQNLGGGLGEVVLPFGRTPSAVAMQIINYSPVGIAKTIISNIGKGKFDQRMFSQGLGRGLTGTAIMAIGAELAKKGLISFDYPRGDEREQELQKAEGVKNNAVFVDGKWRSPMVLGPAGNLILAGGQMQAEYEKSGSPTEAMVKAFATGLKSFTEQTFLTGLEDAINAITDPERYAKSYLPSLISSLVPTIVSDVSRATDSKERQPGGDNIFSMTKERIQSKLPGARSGLEPQIDILGRERSRVGNPLEVMFDPTRPSRSTATPVTQELRRLTKAGHKIAPTKLGDKAGYKGLTKQENTEMWRMAGEIVNNKLGNLFSKEEYQQLDDDQKEKVVSNVIDKSKVVARTGIVLKVTEGLEGPELIDKLKELKASGLINKEVFIRYQEMR